MERRPARATGVLVETALTRGFDARPRTIHLTIIIPVLMVVFTDARLVNHWQGRGCIALAARSVETVSLFLRGRPLKTSAQPTLVLNLDARGQTRFPGGLRARVIIPCVTTGR
eukprot:7500088-Pyramimonas_sp.AAC.2